MSKAHGRHQSFSWRDKEGPVNIRYQFLQWPLQSCRTNGYRSSHPFSKLRRRGEFLVLETYCKDKLAPLALRLALGSFCAYHGFLKIMAAGGTAWFPPLPVAWQVLLSWGEFTAGVAILLGFRCRVAAVLILVLIVGNLLWFQGWHLLRLPWQNLEQPLILLLSALALLFLGAGGLSIDGRTGSRASAVRRSK